MTMAEMKSPSSAQPVPPASSAPKGRRRADPSRRRARDCGVERVRVEVCEQPFVMFSDALLLLFELADESTLRTSHARTGSAVAELNQAAALAEAGDVEVALAVADRLELDQYHYLHATHAELLRRPDRIDDARAAYERALELVHSSDERRFLTKRLAQLEPACDN
jgi:tetratricopeptide (TPR) repeat protein